MEQWKEIPRLHSLYEASSEGRIRSKRRVVQGRKFNGVPSFYIKEERIMEAETSGRYNAVTISVPGKKKLVYVHRLVALAFHGEQPGMHVNHINGNRRDNRAANLEWVTPKENTHHAIANNLTRKPTFSEDAKRRISEANSGANSKVARLVLNTETGIFYDSLCDAAKSIGMHFGRLWHRIKSGNSSFIYA